MAVLNIGGRKVTVDDGFLRMSPEEQQSVVEEISGSLGGSTPQAAVTAPAAPGAAPAPEDDGRNSILGKIDTAMRGAADTLSFGMADEISAGLGTGFGFLGDYDKELARQRGIDTADSENRFGYRLGGQLAGGIGGGVGLAKSGMSVAANAARAGQGLGRVAAGSAADGAIIGGLTGAGSGEGIEGRAQGGAIGSALGGAAGLAAPFAIAGGQAMLSPFLRPFMARIRPETYANRALGEGVRRSGMTTDDIASSLSRAQADGQGMFTVADAMGNSGQRMLSTVARNPNDMRQTVVDMILGRQMDQGRRVAGALQDASGTPLTAAQYQEMLMAQRASDAAKNYAPVAKDISAIDVSAPVAKANAAISPLADRTAIAQGAVPTDLAARAGIEGGEAAIRDPIRQAVKEARSYLASDSLTVTNVEKAFRAKTNIDQMIAGATANGQGGTVDALKPIQTALDDALANTSKQYASARDAYRTASGNIDAIDTGRQMARPRTRSQDNISTFGALPEGEAQRAARIGYFDPLIARAENQAGTMSNSARPFISQSARQELPVIAEPGQADMLMRRLGREQQMFETSSAALGGSKTADNLADAADMSKFDPGIFAGMFRDPLGAAMKAAGRLASEAKGMPPAVMEQVARSLLITNPAAARSLLEAGSRTTSQDALRRAIAAMIVGDTAGGAAGRAGAGRQPLEVTVHPRR